MHSNFNDLNDEIMKFETAKEYIKYLDEQSGKSWSNASDELADAMEDYAKMYHERKLKLLGTANVSQQRELLLAFAGQMQSIDVVLPEKDIEKYVDNFLTNNCG